MVPASLAVPGTDTQQTTEAVYGLATAGEVALPGTPDRSSERVKKPLHTL